MTGKRLAELGVSLEIAGVKTSFSVDIYPEISQLCAECYSDQSSVGSTLSDQLAIVSAPILEEAIPRLVELNQIVSGSLLKACVESEDG